MADFEFERLNLVWHQAEHCRNGVCQPLNEYTVLADGSWLRRFRCLACGEEVFCGVEKATRRIVYEPVSAAQVQQEELAEMCANDALGG